MRCKFGLLLVLALAFVLPARAQRFDLNYYGTVGLSRNDAFSLRIGAVANKLGGEIYAKSDLQRLKKDISKLEGKTYRMALLGGFTYRPFYSVLITANAGYGVVGTYRVDATQTAYGAEDLRKGLELGLGLHLNFGGFMVYGGYSMLPIGAKTDLYKEYTIGMGFMF